jgi:hypothetical protein
VACELEKEGGRKKKVSRRKCEDDGKEISNTTK